jgi:hypothetical protein
MTYHPARFSEPILDLFEKLIPAGTRIHDPCAGTGELLGALADKCGWKFTGTEIEKSFIVDHRVVEGNAAYGSMYPYSGERFWVVTSVAYPNGIADHFKPTNEYRKWKRFTYRQAVSDNEGADRELHVDNMGRYGYRGTKRLGGSKKRREYWRLASQFAFLWKAADRVILNVSDFKSGKVTEPFVQDWIDLMTEMGFDLESRHHVVTNRIGYASIDSRDERVDYEEVLVFT